MNVVQSRVPVIGGDFKMGAPPDRYFRDQRIVAHCVVYRQVSKPALDRNVTAGALEERVSRLVVHSSEQFPTRGSQRVSRWRLNRRLRRVKTEGSETQERGVDGISANERYVKVDIKGSHVPLNQSQSAPLNLESDGDRRSGID